MGALLCLIGGHAWRPRRCALNVLVVEGCDRVRCTAIRVRTVTRRYWPRRDLLWCVLGLLVIAWLVVPVLAGQP